MTMSRMLAVLQAMAHGHHNIGGATLFPQNSAPGATPDPELVQAKGVGVDSAMSRASGMHDVILRPHRIRETAMRFMLIVKCTPEFKVQASTGFQPESGVLAKMAAFHEQLARAGVLLDGSGLKPSR